jgi:hypothetical protein
MHCLATATAWVVFDALPDTAIAEIAAAYELTGSRKDLLAGLRDRVHRLDHAEVLSMITKMKPIAEKYGSPDAVHLP